MNRLHKIFEYAYLLIAIVFIVEGVLRWNSEREKAYFFLGFSVLAIFMFFFKKRFRKKNSIKK